MLLLQFMPSPGMVVIAFFSVEITCLGLFVHLRVMVIEVIDHIKNGE